LSTSVRAVESGFSEAMPSSACALSASSEWSAGAEARGKHRRLEMALPPHLQRYDDLIDLLVDELVREAGAGAKSEAAAGEKPAAADHTVGKSNGVDGEHFKPHRSGARN
jgi:hypothetical protein